MGRLNIGQSALLPTSQLSSQSSPSFNTLRKKKKNHLFYFQAKKKSPNKNFELKSKNKNCNRTSPPWKKSPSSILNNILGTQSKEKKNKVKCSKPTESQKKKKKKETKTQYTRLQPNLKKPEHEQQIHQVKQNHLSKKKQNQNSSTTTTNGNGNLRSYAKATQ